MPNFLAIFNNNECSKIKLKLFSAFNYLGRFIGLDRTKTGQTKIKNHKLMSQLELEIGSHQKTTSISLRHPHFSLNP